MAPVIGGQIKFITRKKDLLHTDFGHIDLVCCGFVARKKEAGSLKLNCISLRILNKPLEIPS